MKVGKITKQVREVDPQAATNLLRAPAGAPAWVRTPPMTSALPTGHQALELGDLDDIAEPVLGV